ncbi:hypothetical protein [Agromyces subbeticus]|nr:hypothetical protein [Agromyces subbeticus]
MIVPGVDLATATDDEIIAGYLELGFDEDDARVYLWQLRNTDPRYPD